MNQETKRNKRVFSLFFKRLFAGALALSLCVWLGLPTVAVPAERDAVSPPTVSAECAILISGESGAVYYEKNADERMGPASTTKLMTAFVAMKHASPDQVITVGKESTGIEGSSIYLTEGERLTLRELLYALLLSSANDAAVAIANAVGGSVDSFCDLMNQEAEEMGLENTHFQNPHGLADEEHYTSARDLGIIAREVLTVPLLREIVSTYKTTISFNGEKDRRLLVNHNKLLRTYEGAIGMKTGFTKKTGRTLVSAAERDGLLLIAVTLNAPDDWRDHAAMLDYGFASYEAVTFAVSGSFCFHLPVTGGEQDSVTLTNAEPLRMILPRKREEARYQVLTSGRFAYAPVTSDKPFGSVIVTCEGQSVSSELISSHGVRAKPHRKNLGERLLGFFDD